MKVLRMKGEQGQGLVELLVILPLALLKVYAVVTFVIPYFKEKAAERDLIEQSAALMAEPVEVSTPQVRQLSQAGDVAEAGGYYFRYEERLISGDVRLSVWSDPNSIPLSFTVTITGGQGWNNPSLEFVSDQGVVTITRRP